MSRSNPTAKNPAQRFMQWSGGEESGGKISYWDKDSESNIEVPMPFTFLVLDELNTITGFNDAQHSGYWSNEVRDMNGELIVRTKQGIQARGTYAQIKAQNLNGLKYAKSVYIAFKDDDGEFKIGHFKFSGAALTAWIEFNKRFDVYKCAVQLLEADGPHKKGSTKYFIPVFDGRKVSAETNAAAAKLDEQLQAYLSTYMARKPDTSEDGYATTAADLDDKDDVEIENIDESATLDDGTPIEEEAPAAKPAAPAKKAAPKTKGDETINLADVPF